MKQLLILGLLITGLSFLTACTSESGKRKPTPNKTVVTKPTAIKILETGEKALITNTSALYTINDTVIVKFVHINGGTTHWVLDENWEKFEGLSHQAEGFPRFYKAIVL